MLPQLNFEMPELLGKKAWVLGFFGDSSFSLDGAGFLVLNYNMLLVDEELGEHSFARLDGNLPPGKQNGAEILVYGEVKDFAESYDAFTRRSTPLISVEKYYVLNQPSGPGEWGNPFDIVKLIELIPAAPALAEAAAGTRASNCDRALIISGGIDDNNNRPRYKDNIIAKFNKMIDLGFSKDQIDVLYDDAGTITVNGDNITDGDSSKAKIKATLERYKNEMPASCTLVIFVTDHGTGYNDKKGYSGARPALPGTSEYQNGKDYPENTFKVDLKMKVYRSKTWTNPSGDAWWVRIDKNTNKLELRKREGGKWVLKGTDTNGDGRITESETGQDIDGDGDRDGFGWREADLGNWRHKRNNWDTDGDNNYNVDVRARWDGTRYIFERLTSSGWKEMGRDTDGDFDIDSDDGGVDWNLDGDKNDRVGFHEGINLWGDEILWDDEFADMLKPLHDKGVHIVVEMVQCYSGGFVSNLKGLVESVGAGSSEDTSHWNRRNAEGKVYAADEMAFLENLAGIDIDSWNRAWEKAKEADRAAWRAGGSNEASRNIHEDWTKPLLTTFSKFYEVEGNYTLTLDLTVGLDNVYDMEIFFGLQQPRWGDGEFTELPEGMTAEKIDGGIKVISDKPFSIQPLIFKFKGAGNAKAMRIHLTDKEHKNLGYTSPQIVTPPPVERTSAIEGQARDLGLLAGTEGAEDGEPVDIAPDDYYNFVYNILQELLDSSQLTGEQHEAVRQLLQFLSGGTAEDRQWLLDIFMASYREAENAALDEKVETIKPVVEVAELTLPISISAESISDDSGCSSTIAISYGATITGAEGINVTVVTLRVNGEIWAESGSVSTRDYENVVSRDVACGQDFYVIVEATTSDGEIGTSSASITTPIPE